MANIIYTTEGPNLRVPGLPYEDPFDKVKPVVLDAVPSEREIIDLIAQSDASTLVNPWSVSVVKGFQAYIPTTYRRITRDMPAEMKQELFGDENQALPESLSILLQLQTELDSKAATIDAATINRRRDLGTVVNKAHLVNRLYLIGRLYGHFPEMEYPMLFGGLTDPETWDVALTDMKLTFVEFMKSIPLGGRVYETYVKKPELSDAEIQRRYPYLEWLKQKLGDNLSGVLLYGSAARSDNPEQYSDFDNWVKVRDIRAAHEVLRGTCPVVVGNDVVENRACLEIPGAKHLGIHVSLDDPAYQHKHIRFLHDSREFLLHTQVLCGEFPFPLVEQDEVVERGLSQAHSKLKSIAGSLNWAYFSPERLVGKPALYEFIVKNIRFFLQHSLNAIVEPNFRDKQTLDALLAERGLRVPKYADDLEHIRASLVYATRAVFFLQEELITKHKPNFDFVGDAQQYKPSEDIEKLWDILPMSDPS